MNSKATIDPYQVLDIGRQATDPQIKKAYRKLAKKWHPDKNPNAVIEAREKFKQINEAYILLTNPETRQGIDRAGQQGKEPQQNKNSTSNADKSNADKNNSQQGYKNQFDPFKVYKEFFDRYQPEDEDEEDDDDSAQQNNHDFGHEDTQNYTSQFESNWEREDEHSYNDHYNNGFSDDDNHHDEFDDDHYGGDSGQWDDYD